ncbi:MAG: hypothetical protein KatS3mg110_4038 [Pirellulaceae bacterium]|nr:MAG: hypothetical protein KatS3mg110_4038 [Pirellulaceae bacterium]
MKVRNGYACVAWVGCVAVWGPLLAQTPDQTYRLFNGGSVTGRLLNPEEQPRTEYALQTRWGTVTFSAAQVAGPVEKSEAELWYEANLPKEPLDVEGHLRMAEECAARGLEAQRVYHLEQVLRLAPDHPQARRELGYSRINDQWVRTDLWYRSRGYVRFKGSWKLPQEVMLAQEEEERKQIQKRWNDQIRLWRQWVLRVPERAQAAANQLRAIEDPAAAPVLIQLLNERNEPAALRRIYLEALAKLPGTAVTQELVKHALADPDAQVREDAARLLAQRADPNAVKLLIRSLKKFAGEVTPIEENVAVNQMARVLGVLKSPEAIPALIDVLVTRHKKTVSLGGGINPTFSSGGGGGLSLGNSSRTLVGDVENAAVRDALVVLSGGANFGFDSAAWRRWYEEQHKPLPTTFDLRRDP